MIRPKEIIRQNINFGVTKISGRGDNQNHKTIYILLHKFVQYLCDNLYNRLSDPQNTQQTISFE